MGERDKGTVPNVVTVLLLLATVLSGAQTEGTTLEKNTISRQLDHIVVKGTDLKENMNRSIPLMGLYAFRDGKMEPIPFQIDEVTAEGDWVLAHRSPYLSEKMADKAALLQEEPPLVVDENDELVFMITDIGDKAAPSFWPSGWHAADEITLTDPLSHEQGWAYLFSFPQPPEPSPVDYVEYRLPENKRDRLYTDNYTLGFSHEVPITQDYIDFRDNVNILDRMKMRMFFRFFFFVKFERSENDMNSCVWQYKDGPVRAVRMVRSSIRLVRNLQSPKINSETLYYTNATVVPVRIKIPKMAEGIINEAYIDSGGDFRRLHGWKVRLNTDERWLSVDGKMDEEEKNVNTVGARWFIIKGPGKAQVVYIQFLDDYGMEAEFNYVDDEVNEYPPEFDPGQVPYIGFRIKDLQKIGNREKFHMNAICFYLNQEYSEQELVDAMNTFDNPIEIETRGFKNSQGEGASLISQDFP